MFSLNDEADTRRNVLLAVLDRIPFLIGIYSSETSYAASKHIPTACCQLQCCVQRFLFKTNDTNYSIKLLPSASIT